MTAGSFEEAIKAFNNSLEIKEWDLTYYQKAKCAMNKMDPN